MKSHIPEEARKRHIAILGMNGSGKTSVAKAEIMEPALEIGERVCNIDPTGVGWGLRLTASGKAKGYSIYIVGGEHADFPLFRRDGHAWAEIVGTTSDSFVFDTSQMTVSDRSLWFTDFAETLLRKNKGPLKLVIDEAHLFAPQGGAKAGGAAPSMLHATNNLLALGRSRGLRITMISQRPAKLHKDSLTQAHTLIAMSLMAPHDRDAVSDWIADQADAARGKEIVASLPTLDPGEGWIWAPKEKVLERVKFSRPRTFDSSSAPDETDGEGPALPAMNPDAIKAKLEVVAKETVANDPRALRAENAKLKAALNAVATPVPAGADERSILKARQEGFADGLKAISVVREACAQHVWTIEDALKSIKAGLAAPTPKYQAPVSAPSVVQQRAVAPAPSRPIVQSGTNGSLPKAERLILTVLAQHGEVPAERIAAIAGYAVKGGGFNNALGSLRSKGYIIGLKITDAGLEALGQFDPLPTGEELLRYWMGKVGKAERSILEAASRGLSDKEGVAREAGYEPTGGGFNNALGRLRTLGLISGRGAIELHEDLR